MNVGVFFCVGGWVVCGGGGINYHAFYTVIVLKSAECWVVSQDFYTCSYCFLVFSTEKYNDNAFQRDSVFNAFLCVVVDGVVTDYIK